MRYEKSENLLKLALEMQGSRIGLTIADIQEKFAVARRTAERMRGALENLFPDHIEQANPGEVPKRWRIHSGDGAVECRFVDALKLLGKVRLQLRKM